MMWYFILGVALCFVIVTPRWQALQECNRRYFAMRRGETIPED